MAMQFNSLHVLATCLNILACIHSTSSLVEIKNDKFHGYINGIYQKLETGDDDSMQEWEFPVNKDRLELLRNDHYVHDTFETCSMMYGSDPSPPSSTMNQSSHHQVSFTENTKVGIFSNHSTL